ncbi:EthD domain-containing protein [Sphingobium sp. EM0848]|uniref:EthD domain-containing protein n=1 Tax=Sphingobium sp. EM0848 TaxID=2743473 RepID=UPI00159CAF4C|nr:EthD domain-containing protein [Sphingobium sp. EM0848]
MIKMVFCLRRLPSLSQAEFQRHWREVHAPLVREAASLLRIRRYVQSHAFADPRITPAVDARGCGVEPYDGIAELWWDSVDDIIAAGASKEGRAAGRRLLADEAKFIDAKDSTLFYVDEHEVVGAGI